MSRKMNLEQSQKQAVKQIRRSSMSRFEKQERRIALRYQTGCWSKADQQIERLMAGGYHLEGNRLVAN